MSTPVLDHQALYRIARRQWRCTCATPGSNNAAARTPGCTDAIRAGDRYVEYLGDAGPYAAGVRYCLPCGVAAWATP